MEFSTLDLYQHTHVKLNITLIQFLLKEEIIVTVKTIKLTVSKYYEISYGHITGICSLPTVKFIIT